MPDLRLENLERRFGAYVAVRDLSLEIAQGEFISLLGPSGCGKTTTLRMIAGFIDPTGGCIALGDRVLSSTRGSIPPEGRDMSMIFQSYAIWPNMTVAQNVGFGLKIRGLSSSAIRSKVDSVLEVMRMGGLRDRYPAELSGGQQQRVAIARAIVVNPSVLLLDEPLSNLDANLREEMRIELRRLHDQLRITTVLVTHDQAEAMVTSDRVAVMNNGAIEQVDRPFDIFNRPRTEFVATFIGRTNLMRGRRDGDRFAFDGFAVPALLLPRLPKGTEATFSIRPQHVRLHRASPAGVDVVIAGSIRERAYLGDRWDYGVAIDGGSAAPLRIAAGPSEVYEIGDRVFATPTIDYMVALD